MQTKPTSYLCGPVVVKKCERAGRPELGTRPLHAKHGSDPPLLVDVILPSSSPSVVLHVSIGTTLELHTPE